MDLNRAMIFAKVVESGGFTAAALRLGAPKTTVSKKVADLEAELGVRLLNRTTRSVKPTEAGLRLYRHCLAALQQLEDGERMVRSLQASPSGALTVAGPGAICVGFLMPAILGFADSYPEVRVTLLSINDLPTQARDDVDVLIWAGLAEVAGHTQRLVGDIELALYASRDYLARAGEPKGPADLADHDAVAFVQSLKGGRYAWRLTRGDVEAEIAAKRPPRLRCDDPAAILAAVAAGRGIGLLPIRYAEMAGAGLELGRVLPEWRGPPIAVRALVADTANLKSRLFVDAIAKWFRKA